MKNATMSDASKSVASAREASTTIQAAPIANRVMAPTTQLVSARGGCN